MSDFPTLWVPPPSITPYSPECPLADYLFCFAASAPVSGAWPAANLALFFPFVLQGPAVCQGFWWMNGGTASGNVDVGIYDYALNKAGSTGATVQAGTNALQAAAPAGGIFQLPAGRYYLAVAASSATATLIRQAPSQQAMRMLGCFQQATAAPLPASGAVTPAAIGQAYAPLVAAELLGIV